jgi:hypothetical protein
MTKQSLFDRIPWLSRFPYDKTMHPKPTMPPMMTVDLDYPTDTTLSPEAVLANGNFGATATAATSAFPEAIAAGMLTGNLAFPVPASDADMPGEIPADGPF